MSSSTRLEEIVDECNTLWSAEFEQKAIDVLNDHRTGVKRPRQEYHIRSKFTLATLASVTKVITKKDSRYMATKETVIPIIRDIHLSTGHKGETKTYKKICESYANIPRRIVGDYIKQCERCTEKLKKKETASGLVIKPITVNDLNQRSQVDLVDFQSLPDGDYKFVMHYQEHLTKYSLLRPLTNKTAKEVARELLKIFVEYGAPHVLQSDNGREFTGQIIHELATLWPDLVLVNGRPRHPQSQGSVERSNATLKDSLVAWMRDHDTSNWSTGLLFIQWSLNTTYHETIKMEPYRALFGVKPKIGLKTNLPLEFLNKFHTGIEEENMLKLIDNQPSDEMVNEDENTDLVGDYIVESACETMEMNGQQHVSAYEEESKSEIVIPMLHSPLVHNSEPLLLTETSDGEREIFSEEMHPAVKFRKVASQNMKDAADKMVERTNKKLKDLKIGSSVNVSVPSFDRGRGDPANLIGIVLEMKDGKYRIGTRGGIIENWLQRNCLESTEFEGISLNDVPNMEFSIRTLVRKMSVGSGQGFKKCTCKKDCSNNKCQCFKNKVVCNSACHPRKSCKNQVLE